MTVDESPQSIADVKKIRRKRLIFVAVAVVLWYVISYVVLTEEPFIYGKVPGFYWLAFHQVGVTVVAIVAPAVAIIIRLIISGFVRTKKISYLLIGAALILLLWMCLNLFVPVISRLHHVQALRYDDHIYYLADRIPFKGRMIIGEGCWQHATDPDCIGGEFVHEYFVFQCGRRGVLCRGIGYEASDEHIWRSHGELFVDVEGNIVLAVDARMIWAYPEGDQ